MSSVPRTQVSALALLAIWLVVCLLCQGFPETAYAHHGGPSDLDGCAMVAEAAPAAPTQLLVESHRCAGHAGDIWLTASSSSGVDFADIRAALHRGVSSIPSPVKLYQVHRVYRL